MADIIYINYKVNRLTVIKRFKKYSRHPKWFISIEGCHIIGSGYKGWRNKNDPFNYDWHYILEFSEN